MSHNAVFYTPPPQINDFDTFFLDIDGVLWLEGVLIPGAQETISRLRKENRQIIFLTNKSTGSRRSIREKLLEAGIDVRKGEIINSPYATFLYIRKKYGRKKIFGIGSKGFFEELTELGHTFTDKNPEFVVIGFKPVNELDKNMIAKAEELVKNGATLIGCNKDRGNPLPDGSVSLGSFYTVGTIERESGKKAIIMGKPHRPMFDIALDYCGVKPAQCLMVGDLLESDILGGQRAGLKAALVMTGYTTREMVEESGIKPDYILKSIADFNS